MTAVLGGGEVVYHVICGGLDVGDVVVAGNDKDRNVEFGEALDGGRVAVGQVPAEPLA